MLRLCGTHQPIRPSRKTIRLTHAETHVTPGARMLAKRQVREPHGCWLGYLMSLMTSDIWLVSRRTIISIRILLFIIVNPILATHQKKGLKNNPESEYTSKPQQHSSTLNPYSVGTVVLHLNPTWSQGNGACGFKLVTWQTHGTPTWVSTMFFTKHVAILPHKTT